MTNLDEKWNPPTREQLMDGGGCSLGDGTKSYDPYVVFRAVCGGNGYFCSAAFRDPEGHGSGATPREAMLSLAKNLRSLADRVEKAAKDG